MALSDFMPEDISEKIMITEFAGLIPAEMLSTNSRNLKDAAFEFDHLKCPGLAVYDRCWKLGGYASVECNQRVFVSESGGRTVNWMIYDDDSMETKNVQGCKNIV